MAKSLKLKEIQDILRSQVIANDLKFNLLKSLSLLLTQNDNDPQIQEVVLRLLERKNDFENYSQIIYDFARDIGLFPYLKQDELSIEDAIAYEFHKPDGLPDDIVFHTVQARIYNYLLQGDNVILSAPTSFGKSLIIDAIIASKKYQNLVIVVPTIALIDETRRRLSKTRGEYALITHSNQKIRDRNIFILTQERVIEIIKDQPVDFFVIDEFYKINPTKQDQDRSIILNQAFYKLYKKGAQFYLLGPRVENINNAKFPSTLNVRIFKTDYKTVITEYIKVHTTNNKYQDLLTICKNLKEPTLIYCASPGSANKVAKYLVNSGLFKKQDSNSNAVEWLRDEYHEKWLLPLAIEHGVGIHHGKIPRAISQYEVKAFNNEQLPILICTSTLIEGVNTKAKNIIIFDNKVAQQKFDFFTFNNICGRSGRMFQHFIGRVFLFHDPPESELPLVDFPIFTQDINAPDRLIIQIDDEDLTEQSKNRMRYYSSSQLDLPLDILRLNSNIEPDDQLRLANEIKDNYKYYRSYFNWSGLPTYHQLKEVCNLIWEYFLRSGRVSGVSSGSQLTLKINQVRVHRSIKRLIEIEVGNETDENVVNDKIEQVLDFVKYWVQFNFPRYLNSLNLIQRHIYSSMGLETGDFGYFAAQIECLFTDPNFIALDEYGIPLQTASKMKMYFNVAGDLDEMLRRIKELRIDKGFTPFEKELISDVKEYL